MTETPRKKKLIETGIPLKVINAESAREKSLRHGLPSTLHLYWARRPLATTRSILFAQLVDDPSAHPDRFPTVEEQDRERARLHTLMERLARWENVNDAELYRQAHQAIVNSNGGGLRVLDPFAGGGAIPLEAQRLGLEAHASDLNPLSVILNKALIDFPARFRGQVSVNPESEVSAVDRAEGMADDIRYYGKLLRNKAFDKIGHLYPKVKDENGDEHTVIAWIWARTVTNPNPANPVQVPLVRSWWLSKKKGHEAWIKPIVENDGTIRYEVQHNTDGPRGDEEGTVNRKGAVSIIDGTPIDFKYIREEGKQGRIGSQLMAIVGDSDRGRVYISPDRPQQEVAAVPEPSDKPMELLPVQALSFRVQAYGFKLWADLFTNRQLTVLTTLADTVAEVREQVLEDALAKGMSQGESLDAGGNGAQAYADAISVYLSLAVSRQTDRCSSINSWDSSRDTIRNVFARQAIPMAWDYAESNPFSTKSGNFLGQVNWVAEAIQNVPAHPQGDAQQADAATRDYTNVVVSTDPPYYDNIGYSDLSDYFYVWLRRMLKDVLPSTVRTTLTPKAQELVANPYRHGGKEGAAEFFVEGFNHVFAHIRETANIDVPMTVYYAYKQRDTKNGGSTGWYALLDGLIKAGWEITATWPVRSELSTRMIASGTNALSSSIVLACRPRPADAPSVTMRIFNSLLRSELTEELRTLMASGIDPVDLNQAAIGPGISVYSRYARIREADGTDMPVQKALEIINRTVDEVMGDADSDYDPDTRFAVKWYQSYGWSQQNTGMADQLARSCGTSPDALVRGGMFEASGGKSRLLTPQELSGEWRPLQDDRVSLWEACVRMAGILDLKGVDAVAPVMAQAGELLPLDQIRALSFRMYHEAEKRKDALGASPFNNLVSMWEDLSLKVLKEAATIQETVQGELDMG
ncbi:DUF1156 domain-containing protein [Bifidobacterium tissieri]|uniref:DUF1156 domain-containing protein n=1 Tax=Bifidobacterium tissieri TaxID=1630162 RepID=A0A5M9ZX80_9BIFI|nr:DUF1156 domain-containing protein [Bifidobacterium tissieri]KAA8832152.1 DUF1156 domain-containing protein [Bifidobacterium tissieri]KAA8832234.1 DUF1156 domain-containing protein [Bifidobacterium tissieri]